MTEAVPALDGGRDLYNRIGRLLFDNQLEPTPENYALGYRYLSGEDSVFANLVERTIRENGGLTAAAVTAILAERNAELSANDLSRIADEAQAYLNEISGIVGSSGDDARDYGAALTTEAAELAAGGAPVRTVDSLVGLTRDMIEKMRTAEGHLRRTGSEITALRDELAAASKRANSDALTGLPNRRAMNTRLRSMTENARRIREPLSLAICDIDNFKQFNDLHGHQIGDEVIKFVGSALSAGNNSDERFVARYGGEEFVLLFDGLDSTAAGAEIDRMRARIAARELKVTATGQSLGRISISAGVSALEKRDSPASLLKRADAALYRAKNGGRNQVCIAGKDE